MKFPFSAGQVLLLKFGVNWALNRPKKERTRFVSEGDIVLLLEMCVSHRDPKDIAAEVIYQGEIYTTLARPSDWRRYWQAVTDPL